jgi:hypothetical protein
MKHWGSLRAHSIFDSMLLLTDEVVQQAMTVAEAVALADRGTRDQRARVGQECERLAETILFSTEDQLEGTSPFLENRQTGFRGRQEKRWLGHLTASGCWI